MRPLTALLAAALLTGCASNGNWLYTVDPDTGRFHEETYGSHWWGTALAEDGGVGYAVVARMDRRVVPVVEPLLGWLGALGPWHLEAETEFVFVAQNLGDAPVTLRLEEAQRDELLGIPEGGRSAPEELLFVPDTSRVDAATALPGVRTATAREVVLAPGEAAAWPLGWSVVCHQARRVGVTVRWTDGEGGESAHIFDVVRRTPLEVKYDPAWPGASSDERAEWFAAGGHHGFRRGHGG